MADLEPDADIVEMFNLFFYKIILNKDFNTFLTGVYMYINPYDFIQATTDSHQHCNKYLLSFTYSITVCYT